MRQMSKLIFRSYRRYYDGAKAVAVPMNITGTSSSRPQGQRSNVPCLRITQPIAALGWSNNNSYGNFTKARISSSERKSRTTKKSTTPSWAADLSRFVTTENKKNKDKISTIVSKWTYKTFETKLPNEIFDYIFNELDSRPSEVMKAVSIDIFKELLVDLLDRCATESLCTLFEERCLNAKKILMKKKLLEKYTDYYDEMAIFARDSKKKKENINEPIEMTIVSKTSRIASIVYGINDKTKLHSEFDLIRFKDRVDELFEWFGAEDPKNGDLKTCKTYLAPYFPLIQSSGTGKTLLLDKFNREAKKSKDTYCELFLCVPDIYGSEIHKQLEIDNMQTGGQPDRDKTWKYLNSLLPDDPTIKKVIFLFDEAHILLEDSALLFRYIRWWLREKGRQQQVVAVFTGTTSKLSKYYPEKRLSAGDSRNPNVRYWNADGTYECYDPFYDLTTMGSWAFVVDHNNKQLNEYGMAALYGRPLFAALQMDENKERGLNDERRYAILERMLFQYGKDYTCSESVLMNILGTRVQMGHVSVSLASKLVSSGYAHLVGFRPRALTNSNKDKNRRWDEDIAHICYQPDPVCAHLAMCIMDEKWTMGKIHGQGPKFWTEAATELLSSGLCHPSKGDVGEVAVALYLLFCGDVVRQRIDSKYMTFSVDLVSYIGELLACGTSMGTNSGALSDTKSTKFECKVNFIQIVHQHFCVPMNRLFEQSILEWMFRSACAMYLPQSSPVFDILAPIKCIGEGGKIKFVPLAVSVKSRRSFGASSIENEFKRMKNETEKYGIQGGVCLLVLLDLETNTLSDDTRLNHNDTATDLTKSVVYKAIEIHDDVFGISKLVQNTRVGHNKECEIYSSHAMLPYLPESMWKEKHNRYPDETWEYGRLAAMRDTKEKEK